MSGYLFISDDLVRTSILANVLSLTRECWVQDLYVESAPTFVAEVIISDVAQLTSEGVMRLRRMLQSVCGANTPLLFLTYGNADRAEAQARLLGATEMLPASSAIMLMRDKITRLQQQGISGVTAELAAAARHFFMQIFRSGQAVTPQWAISGAEQVERTVQQVGIRDWLHAVRSFDEATYQHSLLVTGLATAFSTKLRLNEIDIHRLTKAALLHDVGKTKIPLSILNKPERLTDSEMMVMRTHAALGYDMLVDGGFSREMLQIVRSHHEMLDGSGYPDGLRGNEIPNLVRLVTICDVYGALIERRPYRPAMSGGQAYGVLKSMTGRLDAELVKAFRPVMLAFDPCNGAIKK